MLPGETIASGASDTCTGDDDSPHPPFKLELEVLNNGAEYYIGTFCDYCGPYSRESGYYLTRGEAENDLAANEFARG